MVFSHDNFYSEKEKNLKNQFITIARKSKNTKRGLFFFVLVLNMFFQLKIGYPNQANNIFPKKCPMPIKIYTQQVISSGFKASNRV